MSALAHEVTSEVAYDLMHDHLDTILSLLEGPLPEAEVVERVGSAAEVNRMLRYGLVEAERGHVRAVASVYHQLRQEGMMSFLEHYILPGLTAGVEGEGFATLSTLCLTLPPEAQRTLRRGRVQALFDRLTAVSERPGLGMRSRMTVMVIGTSRLQPDCSDDAEQALRHLKAAAVQRATAAERDLAMLSQFVFLADSDRHQAAAGEVQQFVSSLDPLRASSIERATYHLTVATHWRCATPAAGDQMQ